MYIISTGGSLQSADIHNSNSKQSRFDAGGGSQSEGAGYGNR